MESGKAYVFDNSQTHAVVNPSQLSRVHLVIDTVGSLATFELMDHGRFHPPHAVVGENARAATEEEFKVPAVVEGRRIVFERWRDAPVFTPVPAEEIRDYISYALGLIEFEEGGGSEGKRERFSAMAGTFLAEWKAAAARDALNENTFRGLRDEFLASLLALEACDASSTSSRSPRLVDAVEPILRMAFYECVGWIKHPETAVGSRCVA